MADHENAIQADLAAGSGLNGEAEAQLPLIPDALAGAVAGIDPGAEKRGRGRPDGARNKRDAELVDYCRRQGFRTPIERWFSLINLPVETLAKALECSRLEAAQLQERAMASLAPYVHAKRLPDPEEAGAAGVIYILPGATAGEQKPQFSAIHGEVLDAPQLDAPKIVEQDQ